MEKRNIITIQKIYRGIAGVSVLITGIFLVIGCLMIYRFGTGAYSREAVADMFSVFAIPICLSPVLALIGWILDCIFPYTGKKHANKPDTAFLLACMYGKKDTGSLGEQILAERKKRKAHAMILTIVLAVASAVFLVYACDGSNFDRAEINASMIRAMCVLLPCLAVSFACGVFMLYSREKSLRRELDLAKQLPNAETRAEQPQKNEKYTSILRDILFAVAVILLLVGLWLGGAADVLTKAINICTECIGLG